MSGQVKMLLNDDMLWGLLLMLKMEVVPDSVRVQVRTETDEAASSATGQVLLAQ